MIEDQHIQEAVERVVAVASATRKVIVFGSYGRGEPSEHSDLDLLVIENAPVDTHREYARIREAIGRVGTGVGVDLLVCSQEDFERRASVPGTVCYWAQKEGRVLYDAAA